jgi:hypothetical protein
VERLALAGGVPIWTGSWPAWQRNRCLSEITLPHPAWLGDETTIDAILAAFEKVSRLAGELSHAAAAGAAR